MTIMQRTIDLTDYKAEDLEFGIVKGGQMSIQVEGSASLKVQGKQINANTFTDLAIINASSFEVGTSISKAGLYNVDLSSVDKVKLNLASGGSTAKIHVKVVGD